MEVLVILEQLKAIGITQISEYTLKDFFAQRDYINTTGQEIKEQAKQVGIRLKPCNTVIPAELFPVEFNKHKEAGIKNRAKRKLSPSSKLTKEILYDLYVTQGKTQDEISEIVGIARSSVYVSLKFFKIKSRYMSEKPFIKKIREEIEIIKELHKNGVRLVVIANQYETTVPTITKMLTKNGYSAREENNKKKVK